MTQQARISLVGFRGMGRNYAMMIGRNMVPGMVLTGDCLRKKLLREQFANVMIYENIDEMVLHEADFGAALIVTPHDTHIPIAMQMAELGKHILLEKPAGIHAGEERFRRGLRQCQEAETNRKED